MVFCPSVEIWFILHLPPSMLFFFWISCFSLKFSPKLLILSSCAGLLASIHLVFFLRFCVDWIGAGPPRLHHQHVPQDLAGREDQREHGRISEWPKFLWKGEIDWWQAEGRHFGHRAGRRRGQEAERQSKPQGIVLPCSGDWRCGEGSSNVSS